MRISVHVTNKPILFYHKWQAKLESSYKNQAQELKQGTAQYNTQDFCRPVYTDKQTNSWACY